MIVLPQRLSLAQWDLRYAELAAAGLREPGYGGPLRRHLCDGDRRLDKLSFDNSAAALRLWNFLLSEEARLHAARAAGKKILGVMKDLGTVPVLASALPNLVTFYPDGAWWIPCIMEQSTDDFAIADALGIGDTFCPVRAMLGAFVSGAHFPRPDRLICSVGATCDDFSAIAQRLESLGYAIHWWEIPHRRTPDAEEPAVTLPGGFAAPWAQVDFVREQLGDIRALLSALAEDELDEARLRAAIHQANRVRCVLAELRRLAYTATPCPMPALEMQIAEMLAIHFCSDRDECLLVLEEMLDEVRQRVAARVGVLPEQAARIFWINPVADLRAMNLLEECGGRVCGTEYLFCHALDPIPEDLPPLEALARMALADPMVGAAGDRAERICREIADFGAAGVIISRIPGASHCALEGAIIAEMIRQRLHLPVLEVEVPPVLDAMHAALQTRFEALVETVNNA